jgi:4-amino-4-deoxy-L-arabinose transferase-like glycosyltransferase
LVFARARVQSLTIDEADTYSVYVARHSPSHWEASANNHVLNSLLMRLSTAVFGSSALTLRLPAVLGAALYICAIYLLVRYISGPFILRWPLFACLVFSPFVMDYLVAARGYSLALAFLALALAAGAHYRARVPEARPASAYRAAALISVSLGLSFCANFSFAVVDLATALLLLLWIGRDRTAPYWKVLAATVLPGLAVVYFIAGSVVLSWPKGQFTWGATSLRETGRSILAASLFQPNPYLLQPQLLWLFVQAGRVLFPVLGVCFVWRLAVLMTGRSAIPRGASRGGGAPSRPSPPELCFSPCAATNSFIRPSGLCCRLIARLCTPRHCVS